MTLKAEIVKRYQVLNYLSKNSKVTLSDINKDLDIPIATIKRIITTLRKEYGMNISYINVTSKKKGGSRVLHPE